MSDKILTALVVLGVLVQVALFVGLLWTTHELVQRGDYAAASVSALLFLALVIDRGSSS